MSHRAPPRDQCRSAVKPAGTPRDRVTESLVREAALTLFALSAVQIAAEHGEVALRPVGTGS
jgi:hypothetical protein